MTAPITRYPRWRQFVVAALSGMLPAFAQADAGNVINYSVGVTATEDANLFRLAPGVDPQTAIGSSDKSDTVTTTTVGVVADKEIGLQRLKLDMQLSKASYRKFRRLDNDSKNLAGNWAWAVGGRLRGDISTSRKTALSGFDQSASTTRNINTATTHSASLYLKLAADWEVFGVVGKNDSANSAADLQAASYLTRSTESGLRYTSPAGHQLTLRQRQTRSAQVSEDTVDASATWAYSAITQFSGGVGRVVRRAEGGATPETSGATGNLGVSWAPTGKTKLNLAMRQEVAAAAANFTTSTTVRSIALGAGWEMAAKTSLQFSLDRSQTSFSNDPLVLGAQREDRQRNAGLTLSYRPDRWLSLSLTLRDEARDSNEAAFIYRDRLGTATAQFAF